jgi:hypothetical protein
MCALHIFMHTVDTVTRRRVSQGRPPSPDRDSKTAIRITITLEAAHRLRVGAASRVPYISVGELVTELAVSNLPPVIVGSDSAA